MREADDSVLSAVAEIERETSVSKLWKGGSRKRGKGNGTEVRTVWLSAGGWKLQVNEEEAEAIEYSSNETAGTSLGDLLSKFKL